MSPVRSVFVGNRRFVLLRMFELDAPPTHAFVVKGTHLHRDLEEGLIPQGPDIVVLESKAELLRRLELVAFDVLVSNGCPYVLPIGRLPDAKYVNVHPSALPDLRGKDPVIGAMLFGRAAGATCHLMDETIDTGPIISQVHIPMTEDLDVTLLYQLSFLAESQAYEEAAHRNFTPVRDQPDVLGLVSYARAPGDQELDFTEPDELIIRKVRSFSNRTAGCRFRVDGREFRVFSAETLHNPYLAEKISKIGEGVVYLSFENSLVFRRGKTIWRFGNIEVVQGPPLKPGCRIF